MRRYILPASVFVFAFVLAVLTGFLINAVAPTTVAHSQVSAASASSIRLLTGYEHADDTSLYQLELTCADDCPELAVVSFYPAPRSLVINGGQREFGTLGSLNGNILVATIPADLIGTGQGLSIALDCPSQNMLATVSVCSLDAALRAVSTYNLALPMVYGLLGTISAYGFLMFLSKRDKMLFIFSGYTFCLFVWCILPALTSVLGLDPNSIRRLSNMAFDFAVVLGMATCMSCCRLVLKGRWQVFGTWYGLAAVCLAFSLVIRLFPSDIYDKVLFGVYTVGAAILVGACGRSQHKPWVVLCGLAVTQGFRFVAMFSSDPTMAHSFTFSMLHQMRVFTMPFLAACLIYIASDFASRFKDTELLSHQLEKTNRELDLKVEERTRELVEQQGRRTALIANISHDLRTPLFVMRGCIDRLKGTPGLDPAHDTLRVLDEQLGFTSQLTEDLFSSAKLEDDTLVMETEPVDMAGLLESIVRASSIEASEKGMRVHLTACGRPTAWGDETWLARAFQNLVTNSVAHSGAHAVDVGLGVEDDTIRVTVTDDGSGIEPAELDHIFERYYRPERSQGSRSSGLGLCISSDVIRHHGGTLEVSSTPGAGTCFTATLPLWGMLDKGSAPKGDGALG